MPVDLSAVAAALPRARQRGGDATLVDVTHDSRQAAPGTLFCCVPGLRVDGHDHAPGAVEAGAAGLLVERWLDLPVPQIRVPSVRVAMGPAASQVHGHPSDDLTVVGVTGTNGKTTSVSLLEGALAAAGQGVGTIGTVSTRIHGVELPGVRTTPEGPDLQRLLATMRTRGVDAVAMEVSSHGLDLRRVDGTRFAVAVFTNLSQDHLDWHGSMDVYAAAKARLFTAGLAERGVIHLDGQWGRHIRDQATVPVTTFGRDDDADHQVLRIVTDARGGHAELRGPDGATREIHTSLFGGFNVLNAVGAVLAAEAVGIPAAVAEAGVAAAPGPAGRMERVDVGQPFTVLVDYAHTPEAITKVLGAVRASLAPGARVHLVVGAGGDRDRGKRTTMGLAAALADVAVLTTDNPRSEAPEAILDEVARGAQDASDAGARAEVHAVLDRRDAIARALRLAAPGDVVVVAGKGHETGQEIGGRTLPFDDREVVREVLTEEVRA